MTAALAVLLMAVLLAAAVDVHAASCADTGRRVLWGDLHVHTGYSMDAYALGARRDPAAAYRFARGEAEILPGGERVALDRPLDFAAVTDHAETFGVMNLCTRAAREHPYCRAFEAASDGSSRTGFTDFFLPVLNGGEEGAVCADADCRVAQIDLWARTIEAAETANAPCEFTAFVANEWSATPGDLHWHRNLIYAGARVPEIPVNAHDEPTAPDMWRSLAARCKAEDGCRVLAIPHNPNLGMGGSFDIETLDDGELALRAHYERVLEIHQHKGQSECYPGTGFTDEACDFEIRLPTPLLTRETLTPEEHAQVATGYARASLAKGLLAAQAGRNPLQLGFIGSTDTHIARPGAVDELGWRGHAGKLEEPPEARFRYSMNNPGGLAAVWAEENTRDAIFAALARRETYATSGPRITLETFATRDAQDWCARDGRPADAVPMGGTLPAGEGRWVLYVRALKDRTALARVDLVQLALVDGAVRQSLSSVPAGEGGAATLCARFEDGGATPGTPALWYARVLEMPTPRWRTEAGDVAETVQERAWSSPIWSAAGAPTVAPVHP